jgi:hypothetical protein
VASDSLFEISFKGSPAAVESLRVVERRVVASLVRRCRKTTLVGGQCHLKLLLMVSLWCTILPQLMSRPQLTSGTRALKGIVCWHRSHGVSKLGLYTAISLA